MLIRTEAVIAILILLFIIIMSTINIIKSIKEKEYILMIGSCIPFIFAIFMIFWGINQEIKENIKRDKYKKTILYNECGMPQDMIIKLIN